MRPALLLFIGVAACGERGRPAAAPAPGPSTAAPPSSTEMVAGGSPSQLAAADPTATPAAASGSALVAARAAPSNAAQGASSAPPPATGGSVLVGEIPSSKKFDPKGAVEGAKPAMVECYNKARAGTPALAGKLKLLILVNAGGSVLKVDVDPSGSANNPTLVACIGEAFKTVTFPKPGGMATIAVPLAFRP